MLCTHKTTSSASLVLKFVLQFNNSYLNQFSSISGGNCISPCSITICSISVYTIIIYLQCTSRGEESPWRSQESLDNCLSLEAETNFSKQIFSAPFIYSRIKNRKVLVPWDLTESWMSSLGIACTGTLTEDTSCN